MIFPNSNRLSIEAATRLIREKLISEEFFIPQDLNLPTLHFHPYDPELDHDYHEFESWEETYEKANDPREAGVFLQEIQRRN